jgi:hypothetical protein
MTEVRTGDNLMSAGDAGLNEGDGDDDPISSGEIGLKDNAAEALS